MKFTIAIGLLVSTLAYSVTAAPTVSKRNAEAQFWGTALNVLSGLASLIPNEQEVQSIANIEEAEVENLFGDDIASLISDDEAEAQFWGTALNVLGGLASLIPDEQKIQSQRNEDTRDLIEMI